MSGPAGISIVQMIQALRGCVHELNKSDDHRAALKAQQTLVSLDELYSELRSAMGDDDAPYQPWPLIRREYEIEQEAAVRERESQEPQS